MDCGGTPWTVCRVVRDMEWNEVLLQPEGAAADAPVLCARLGPDQAVQVGETVTVSFDPAPAADAGRADRALTSPVRLHTMTEKVCPPEWERLLRRVPGGGRRNI